MQPCVTNSICRLFQYFIYCFNVGVMPLAVILEPGWQWSASGKLTGGDQRGQLSTGSVGAEGERGPSIGSFQMTSSCAWPLGDGCWHLFVFVGGVRYGHYALRSAVCAADQRHNSTGSFNGHPSLPLHWSSDVTKTLGKTLFLPFPSYSKQTRRHAPLNSLHKYTQAA